MIQEFKECFTLPIFEIAKKLFTKNAQNLVIENKILIFGLVFATLFVCQTLWMQPNNGKRSPTKDGHQHQL